MGTSIEATQRKLIVGIVVATLMALAIAIADLASGGRADPPTLRAAAILLDGAWRFHTGDDPRWAAANIDENGWEPIDLTAVPGSHDGDVGLPDYVGGWMAHGHPGYRGYAWYRRAVTVPAGPASWDILGPTLVENGYEVYWNGQRLGGSGRLGPAPRVVGTRPMRFALPADAAGTSGVLAVRAYMRPGSGVSRDHRSRVPFGERDKRQPTRVDRVVCGDRRAHRPQRTDAEFGARHARLDHGRAIRRRVARSDRRAGHLVSVRHRRVADAVRLRDRYHAPGLFGRANLAFQGERIDRAAVAAVFRAA